MQRQSLKPVLILLAAMAGFGTCHAFAATAQTPSVYIRGHFGPRVTHLYVDGEMYNGTHEIGTASGFLLGDNTVITNSHVVPEANNYRHLSIEARISSISSTAIDATLESRDVATDIAVLRLAQPAMNARPLCPIETVVDTNALPEGTPIFVLGFPIDRDQSIAGGLISNKMDTRNRWQTDALLNPGNSGGPVFSADGYLVGLTSGGIVSWMTPDGRSINVTGVNFFVPANSIFNGTLKENLSREPACWKAVPGQMSRDFIASLPLGGVNSILNTISPRLSDQGAASSASNPPPVRPVQSPDADTPAVLNRDFYVSQTRDDHLPARSTESYVKTLEAEPGYAIDSCGVEAYASDNSSGARCNIVNNGASANFRVDLTSGPAEDRYNGLWSGTISLRQRRR